MIYGLVAAAAVAAYFAIRAELADRRFRSERNNLLAAAEVERYNLTEAWTQERRELLNRIQRPEIVQTAPVVENFPTLEPEPDDIGLVGSIRHDPDYEFDSTLADALTEAAFPQKG